MLPAISRSDNPRPADWHGFAVVVHATEAVPSIAAFQQLEVDYYIGTPNKHVHATDLQETPIVRMYGVTENGESRHQLCLCLHGIPEHTSQWCAGTSVAPPSSWHILLIISASAQAMR